jgi:chaperonin cofactor prefoldin
MVLRAATALPEDGMGLFWDLYQQSQISEHGERAESLEARVDQLERQNERLATLLREVIGRLEKHVGVDLDKDGRVG